MKRQREEISEQDAPKKLKLNSTPKQQDYTLEELIKIIRNGDVAIAKTLIARIDRQELNKVGKQYDKTVLHIAASNGHKEVCEMLIPLMTTEIINAVDNKGYTALHLAVQNGNKEVCALLISNMSPKAINIIARGVDVYYGKTALHYAAEKGWKEICKLILDKCPEASNTLAINTTNLFHYDNEKTALHLAIQNRQKEVCELLIPYMRPETINATDECGQTTLYIAADSGMREVCELLIPLMTLEAINAVTKGYNYSGQTALHIAAREGMKEVCELLIPLMTPKTINAVDQDRCTALHFAIEKGHKEVCELLIPFMTEAINAVDKDSRTVLHIAAREDMKEVCEMLIPLMTPEAINAINKRNGYTALHYAAASGMKEVCETLIPLMTTEVINAVTIGDFYSSGKTALYFAADRFRFYRDVKEVFNLFITASSRQKIIELMDKDDTIYGGIFNLIDNFGIEISNVTSTSIEFIGSNIKLLHLYQHLTSHDPSSSCDLEVGTNTIDTYISKNYFQLIGVCKNVSNPYNDLKPLLHLPTDIMKGVLSYLWPHSLLPQLFPKVEEKASELQQEIDTLGNIHIDGA